MRLGRDSNNFSTRLLSTMVTNLLKVFSESKKSQKSDLDGNILKAV